MVSALRRGRRGPAAVHLLAGGRGSRRAGADPLLSAALAEAGRPRPSVAYVGVASDDDPDFFRMVSSWLTNAGAGEVRLAALASRRARPADARTVLAGADVVFVGGGDVEAGMARLAERGALPWLAELHRGGTPVVGLSAGSIMLARSWVRWSDPDDDAGAELFPCLGLAPLLCDCHGEDDGWEELRALLALAGDGVGYGIPAGGALRVAADGAVRALGAAAARFERRAGRTTRAADLLPA